MAVNINNNKNEEIKMYDPEREPLLQRKPVGPVLRSVEQVPIDPKMFTEVRKAILHNGTPQKVQSAETAISLLSQRLSQLFNENEGNKEPAPVVSGLRHRSPR